jgi:hypothetical protein
MSTYVETAKPTMMATGGVTSPPEIIGFDAATAAAMIASGAGASSGAPGAFVPLPTTRVKFTGLTGPVMVNGVPPLFNPGEVATFLSPISAQLIAAGLAILN